MARDSNSDDDYSDAEQAAEVAEACSYVPRIIPENEGGLNVRGNDINWTEVETYADEKTFHESDLKKKLDEEFTIRKNREFHYADVKVLHCKYSRKVGYRPCPWMFKISYKTYNSEVVVETNDNLDHHIHEIDESYADKPGSVFKWTDEMNKIIEESIKNRNLPTLTMRNLEAANVFHNRRPTMIQLYNKCAAMKKKVFPAVNIVNTHHMRQKIKDHVEPPECDNTGFIPYWEILDENDDDTPRFCVIFTTEKNQALLSKVKLLQTDATYRLNWMGFPVYVLGTMNEILI